MRSVVAAVLLLATVLVVAGAATLAPIGGDERAQSDLRPVWVADTSTTLDGNHHQPAILRADGEAHVAVPLNGADQDCRVVVLHADGTERWRHEVPQDDCHGHAVGDVATASFPGDELAVLVATGEERVLALDAAGGEAAFRHELADFGYSPPVVIGSEPDTLVVADFLGTVTAVAADGTERWTLDFGGYVWDRPRRAPGPNGTERVVIAGGTTGEAGLVRAIDVDGSSAWSADFPRPVYSTARTAIDGEPVVVSASNDGTVAGLRTADGSTVWSRSFGSTARVATAGDAVYVTDERGTVRRLGLENGSTTWTRSPGEPGDTASPIGLADLNGSEPVPVVLDPAGRVALLAPSDGTTLATRGVDAELFAPPTTGDVTGDGRDEIAIVYADGRTALLEYDGELDTSD